MIFAEKRYDFPCVYACLSDKTADSYVEMIRVIGTIVKPLGDLLNLPYHSLTALTDFEQDIDIFFVK